MPSPHAASRVLPLTRLRVTVDAAEKPVPLEPAQKGRIAFILAVCEDPKGLDAFGVAIRPSGDSGMPYPAPDKTSGSRTFPPAALTLPPGLHRAEEYPSPFRGRLLGCAEREDLVIQNLAGALPYNVDVYIFLEDDD